jgi:hypothetical protein
MCVAGGLFGLAVEWRAGGRRVLGKDDGEALRLCLGLRRGDGKRAHRVLAFGPTPEVFWRRVAGNAFQLVSLFFSFFLVTHWLWQVSEL